MASSFEGDLFGSSAWDVLKAFHGENATITPQTGSVTTCKVIFKRGEVSEGVSDERGGRAWGTLLVPPSSVTGWTPTVGDVVVIGSVTYAANKVVRLEPDVELELIATATS